MNYILETGRLRLREFIINDAPFIVELLNSPGWIQFIGDRNVKTEEQAITYLVNGPLKSYKQNGFGLSLVETKDNIPVGMCGLIKRDYLDHPDIGFAFLPEFNSKGYAFEIAEAVLSYARSRLAIQTILAITIAENIKSIRLLEKIGLTFSGTVLSPGSEEVLQLYSTQ